jgi:hypothetical protein
MYRIPFWEPPCPVQQVGEGDSPTLDAVTSIAKPFQIVDGRAQRRTAAVAASRINAFDRLSAAVSPGFALGKVRKARLPKEAKEKNTH